MSDEVEGIRGEYRRPTPAEIGLMVRLFREQRGIKRASLASDANVSGAAFTTAAYIPTIEEFTEKAKREQEELRKTHDSVAVERLTDPRQLLDDAKAIEECGYEVRAGITDRYSMAGSRIQMAVVTFIPTSASEMPSVVWLPKKMTMG